MNLRAGQPAILPEDEFFLAMNFALKDAFASLQSELQNVIHDAFEQLRLTTPTLALSQRRLEHSSTLISDPEIEIVHSHLWKARCKQVALKSTAVTGGVKKRHRSRPGNIGSLATCKHPKRKVSFQRLVDVKADWRFQSSVVPSVLGITVSTQLNFNSASDSPVSDITSIPNWSFVNEGCDGVISVFVAKVGEIDENLGHRKEQSFNKSVKVNGKQNDNVVASIFVGIGIKHHMQCPDLCGNGREHHALQPFDEMPKSKGLCSVGEIVTSIRDKGGGLAHRPVEHGSGVNCEEEDETLGLNDDTSVVVLSGSSEEDNFAAGVTDELCVKSDSKLADLLEFEEYKMQELIRPCVTIHNDHEDKYISTPNSPKSQGDYSDLVWSFNVAKSEVRWDAVLSCYVQNKVHMGVSNAMEAEISDIGNGFPLVFAPDILDNKRDGVILVNNQDGGTVVHVMMAFERTHVDNCAEKEKEKLLPLLLTYGVSDAGREQLSLLDLLMKFWDFHAGVKPKSTHECLTLAWISYDLVYPCRNVLRYGVELEYKWETKGYGVIIAHTLHLEFFKNDGCVAVLECIEYKSCDTECVTLYILIRLEARVTADHGWVNCKAYVRSNLDCRNGIGLPITCLQGATMLAMIPTASASHQCHDSDATENMLACKWLAELQNSSHMLV